MFPSIPMIPSRPMPRSTLLPPPFWAATRLGRLATPKSRHNFAALTIDFRFFLDLELKALGCSTPLCSSAIEGDEACMTCKKDDLSDVLWFETLPDGFQKGR
mmetsp:Transcript_25289/g.53706  ORF Transcript_25289/g.53706 Transcript_25289/m.53706 type:complete len:102 (-) Transcript_25289:66-371(-)